MTDKIAEARAALDTAWDAVCFAYGRAKQLVKSSSSHAPLLVEPPEHQAAWREAVAAKNRTTDALITAALEAGREEAFAQAAHEAHFAPGGAQAGAAIVALAKERGLHAATGYSMTLRAGRVVQAARDAWAAWERGDLDKTEMRALRDALSALDALSTASKGGVR